MNYYYNQSSPMVWYNITYIHMIKKAFNALSMRSNIYLVLSISMNCHTMVCSFSIVLGVFISCHICSLTLLPVFLSMTISLAPITWAVVLPVKTACNNDPAPSNGLQPLNTIHDTITFTTNLTTYHYQ